MSDSMHGEVGVIDRRTLLENYLAFLGSHRGAIIRGSTAIELQGQAPGFTFAFLERGPDTEILARHGAVRLTPWSEGWQQELAERNYTQRGALVFMALAGQPRTRGGLEGLRIEPARSERDMKVFSDVQTRGFLEGNESYETWFAFLHQANMKNLDRPEQSFYVGFLNGEPVGVTLMLLAAGVAGIYAVATLPSHRQRGISSALLAHAVAEGNARGCRTIALQVGQGSSAERLYTHLGFQSVFDCLLFNR